MWFQGNHVSTAAGQRLGLWDNFVCLHPNWSCHDAAAGANAKVYKCEDPSENVLFYVLVNDNQVNYSLLQLWEDWDEVAHEGIGQNIIYSSSTNTFCHWGPIGAWGIAVNNRRVILCDMVTFTPTYIGSPRKYDNAKNIVFISTPGTSATGRLGVGQQWSQTSSNGSRFLFDENGSAALLRSLGGLSNLTQGYARCIDNITRWTELPIISEATLLVCGVADGVIGLGAISSTGWVPGNGETVEIDGVDWMVMINTLGTGNLVLVRKD